MILDLLSEAVDYQEDDRIAGYGMEIEDALADFYIARWEVAGPISEERERIKSLDHGGGYAEDE